jgi:hypothetical protein
MPVEAITGFAGLADMPKEMVVGELRLRRSLYGNIELLHKVDRALIPGEANHGILIDLQKSEISA